ncbi:MAG TPA: FadR/GntR family transcriptional regulator [Actinomycetes bacterium]|nr:FadR/GntR family transcriptional regulator [Actinomycetes bacterium]
MVKPVRTADPPGVGPVAPAYRQVAEELRAQVLSGALSPGERLPNENDLSARFGVGRSTVREALRVLSSQNMVVTSRGVSGGSFVAHPDVGQVSEYLETSLGLLSICDEVGFEELMEARELLEVPAARLAAIHCTNAQLQGLRTCVNEDAGAATDDSQFEVTVSFHQRMLVAAGNRLLAMMTGPIFGVLHRRYNQGGAPGGFWAEIADDHRRILEQVEARDADGAAAEMHRHLQHMGRVHRQFERTARYDG